MPWLKDGSCHEVVEMSGRDDVEVALTTDSNEVRNGEGEMEDSSSITSSGRGRQGERGVTVAITMNITIAVTETVTENESGGVWFHSGFLT